MVVACRQIWAAVSSGLVFHSRRRTDTTELINLSQADGGNVRSLLSTLAPGKRATDNIVGLDDTH